MNNNRMKEQIQAQQINNEINNQSNISRGMTPYQNYKRTNYKSSIDSPNSNKRMKNQLNNNAKINGGTLGSVNRGVEAAKNYKSADTVKDKENAKSQMKGSVANTAVTAATGSQTLGNLAEKAVKMKDKLNPLKAMKNAVLGKINGDDNQEDQYDELGNPKQQENRLENVSFTVPPKVIKWAVIAGIPAFSIIIFITLFVTASQTYVNILGIDSADKVTEEQLESKDDSWFEKGKGSTEVDNVETFNYNSDTMLVDNFIDYDNSLNTKSSDQSVLLVARKHESNLSDINDYFSNKLKCSGKDCQNQPEYLFYLKMNDIYMLYSKKYKVKLDLPLLMSALSISDEQASEVYVKNSKGYSVEKHEKTIDYIESNFSGELLDIDLEFDYKSINNYTYLSTSDYTYDMQILAQNMVTKDGDKYKKDLDHFDEFLDEYIEMKYYVSDTRKKEIYSKNNGNSISNGNTKSKINGDFSKWRQCSNEWGSKVIRKGTMCEFGCYITSIAIQVARSETNLTVDNFDPTTVLNNATFNSDDDLINPMFNKYAPNFRKNNDISTISWSKSSIIKRVKKEIEKGNYPIIFVDNHHFVAATGTTNDDILIIDPASDSHNLYNLYTNVTQIQIFSKED